MHYTIYKLNNRFSIYHLRMCNRKHDLSQNTQIRYIICFADKNLIFFYQKSSVKGWIKMNYYWTSLLYLLHCHTSSSTHKTYLVHTILTQWSCTSYCWASQVIYLVCCVSVKGSHTKTSLTSGPWAVSSMRWRVNRRHSMAPTCQPLSTRSWRYVALALSLIH